MWSHYSNYFFVALCGKYSKPYHVRFYKIFKEDDLNAYRLLTTIYVKRIAESKNKTMIYDLNSQKMLLIVGNSHK